MKTPLRKLHGEQAIQIQRAIKTKEEVNFCKYSNNRNRQYRNPDFTPRPTFTLQHLYHHYYNKIKITTLAQPTLPVITGDKSSAKYANLYTHLKEKALYFRLGLTKKFI